ncbi:hypothetical protein B4068_3994 [Bacillus subtilis]|nr:hypothetical protein B4068_3994 [Bacillus subtilis]
MYPLILKNIKRLMIMKKLKKKQKNNIVAGIKKFFQGGRI